ncbi:hypothetical protein HH212_00150 [Massilia forsythiae]|uniref:Uncharacterized protein n=1 Tax=Massilia forsythiae TaxID=2728020 RepID=A0A7Z2VT12_9BURK|nr:hypothetical protein [Massilia forsythiae]QJD98648.1 hypothetical protein HH212_00150 [Massilia forsythiae]
MSNLNENTPARRADDNRQAGSLAWDGVTPAPAAELRAAAAITVDQLEHLNPSRTGLGIMERREGGAYVRVADVRRMDATRAAAGVPAHEQDLLDIVRTLCSTAQRLAELSPVQRANYPSPLSPMSPLFQAASAACIERGYTRWGLAIEGVAYPVAPAAQPASVAAGLTKAQFEEIAQSWDGCAYDGDMIPDIGAALRRDFDRLASLAPVAAELVRQVPKKSNSTVITLRQAQRLVEFFGGHDASMTITEPAPDWEQQIPGLYAYCTEYPEDGAQYLGPTEVDISPICSAAPQVPTAAEARIADLEQQLAECVALTNKWAAAAGEADGRAVKARAAALEEAAQECEGVALQAEDEHEPAESLGAYRCRDVIRAFAAAPSVEVKGEQGEMGGDRG